MKISEITIDSRYIAKVSGALTIVRIVAIREMWSALSPRTRKLIVAVNEHTGRTITFRSAARLRTAAAVQATGGVA